MKLKYILLIALNLVFSFLIVFLVIDYKATKVAYVRTDVLINEYDGTREVLADFNQKKLQWQSNIDTLKFNFETAVASYNSEFEALTNGQRQERESELARLENQLDSYTRAISEKVKDEDSRLMEGLINQLNSFIESYGEENNYEIIMGTAMSGTILYGKEDLDITDELILVINKKYSGE